MVEGRPIETSALVTSLRSFIREALDLEPIPGKVPIPAKARPDPQPVAARAAAAPKAERAAAAEDRAQALVAREWEWVAVWAWARILAEVATRTPSNRQGRAAVFVQTPKTYRISSGCL